MPKHDYEDPIVAEVRKFRDQLAADHGNDLDAIVSYLREEERKSGKRLIALRPRRPQRLKKTA